MTQLSALTDGLFQSVKGYIGRSLDAFDARLKAVEARQPVKGDKGENGKDATVDLAQLAADVLARIPAPKDGKDADPLTIRTEVEKAVAAIPKPKDGESVPLEVVQTLVAAEALRAVAALNLKNGKDADEFAIYERVMGNVTRALDAIPVPKNGKDADQVDVDLVIEAVLKRMPAIRDGKDAEPVDVDKLADAVFARVRVPKDGADGKNGLDFDPEIIRAEVDRAFKAAPVVDVEKIALDVLSRIPAPRDGRDGANGIGIKGEKGQDGRDGFGLDDFDAEMKDGRTLVIKLGHGERQVSKEIRLEVPLYRGVYRPGAYEKGDCITYGGSVWIAKSDTDATPGGGSPDWQLSVKAGRDAK